MRLSTHNLLACTNGCVRNGYPLSIFAVSMKYEECQYDLSFTSAMILKLDYDALLQALEEMRQCPESAGVAAPRGGIPELPPALPADHAENEEFLGKLHAVLFELDLVDGALVCPACSHEYPVKDGFPEMLVNDNEVGAAVA
eukprot:TRINITY_DN5862_c0_g2_i1.p1 TRINITY_DN5862_c0_g2~~TRINITY_DN5862_c0_g2_i1.p1  ORF type:complete len:142 (-),score=23.45 TRINITY_DN5862_c0_g2_i1:205-630(-)